MQLLQVNEEPCHGVWDVFAEACLCMTGQIPPAPASTCTVCIFWCLGVFQNVPLREAEYAQMFQMWNGWLLSSEASLDELSACLPLFQGPSLPTDPSVSPGYPNDFLFLALSLALPEEFYLDEFHEGTEHHAYLSQSSENILST